MKSLRLIMVCILATMLATGNAFAVTSVVTVTANLSSTSSISVTTPIAFGTITGSATTYRFKTPTADVSYFAAGPYEIRVYTDNGVGSGYADGRGFIRDANTVAANRLYMKVWCPNFNANPFINNTTGPALMTPSSATESIWAGKDLNADGYIDGATGLIPLTSGTYSEATYGDINGDGDIADSFTATVANPISEQGSFSYMRELDIQTEGDTTAAALTRCVLACNTPVRGDKSLGNPFKVFLATDVNGVKPATTYSSALNGPLNPITTGQSCLAGVIFELLTY